MDETVAVPFKAFFVKELHIWYLRLARVRESTVQKEFIVQRSLCFFNAGGDEVSNVSKRKVDPKIANSVFGNVHVIATVACLCYGLAPSPSTSLEQMRDR